MQVEIVGRKKIDVDRGDTHIHGWSIYCTWPEVGIEGLSCERIFIPDQMISRDLAGIAPKVEDVMDFEYNKYGKIGSIQSCKSL